MTDYISRQAFEKLPEPCEDTISRQAALDVLDEIRDALWGIDIPSPTIPEYVEHHEQVQSVLKLLDKKQKELYIMPSAQQWIPCSEKQPKKQEKSYWICTGSGYQCECRWTNINHLWTHLTTNWHWHFADIPQYAEVVAWMPLPEPYKGE